MLTTVRLIGAMSSRIFTGAANLRADHLIAKEDARVGVVRPQAYGRRVGWGHKKATPNSGLPAAEYVVLEWTSVLLDNPCGLQLIPQTGCEWWAIRPRFASTAP